MWLYKARGLDVSLAPRAHRLDSSEEPKLANTVLMNDLGKDGFKNLNRRECLNLEQTKFALRKLAQYHAATAMMIEVNGPFPDVFMKGMLGTNKDAIKAFMEGMLGPFQAKFLEHLEHLKGGEQYRDKLVLFLKLSEYDPSEFCVLNHGDCWMNNLLFKLDSKGEPEDMVFVDVQNPNYGSPVQDIFYLIITSLTKHLDLLAFTGRQPSLRELHLQFYKYGDWALFPAITVLPVVLLGPTEGATFENFVGENQSAGNFKDQLFTNPQYRSYIAQLLPWLDNRELLDIEQMIKSEAPAPLPAQPESSNKTLDWLDVNDFSDIIAATDPEFESIVSGSSILATKPGDNYASAAQSLEVTFSPKSYRLSKPVKEEYLILENLQTRRFKMCDRMKGKQKGIFIEKTAEIFKNMFAQSRKTFLDVIAKFQGSDEYMHKMPSILEAHVAEVIKDSQVNEEEFNVLNHGDAWVNNIMFKYDSDDYVQETYLIDHPVSQYGNPAQDLYYFIMSSTELDIKVDQFDYLIRWYHQNLVEHAGILKYSGFVPTLKELHLILIQHPIFAVGTLISTLSICLNKADDRFTTDAVFGDNPESDALRSGLTLSVFCLG
ncbi:Hypothetical predicted protein [Drosophila guanche]|uniref:CHK kinase-like domain-containing protein n=1 Tax=Drosophila guanche TaxID=7266 RepID=A0A3B0KT75_DROGU|nr:Hypothetical predicted protein [Drosophila guanche]